MAELEKKHDDPFKIVFETTAELMTPPERPRRKIGFEVKDKRASCGKRTKKSKR